MMRDKAHLFAFAWRVVTGMEAEACGWLREYRFDPTRKWRADWALPAWHVLVEVDGGNRMAAIGRNGQPYAIGRHTQDADLIKINSATAQGWRVFRLSPVLLTNEPDLCIGWILACEVQQHDG